MVSFEVADNIMVDKERHGRRQKFKGIKSLVQRAVFPLRSIGLKYLVDLFQIFKFSI